MREFSVTVRNMGNLLFTEGTVYPVFAVDPFRHTFLLANNEGRFFRVDIDICQLVGEEKYCTTTPCTPHGDKCCKDCNCNDDDCGDRCNQCDSLDPCEYERRR